MKSILILVLSVALGALLSMAATAQTSVVNVKSELSAVYALYDKALMTRNFRTVAAFYAPDYESETEQGTTSRAESLKNMQDFLATASEVSNAKTTLEKLEQTGGTTVAFINRQIKGSMIFAGGKKREFEISLKAEEYWTKNDKDVWLLYSTAEHGQTLKIDGIEENADVLESSRTQLEAVYEKIDAALKTRNIGAMFVYWAPDFTETEAGKESTSEEIEADLRALFAKISVVSNVSHKISSIKIVDRNHVIEVKRIIEGDLIVKGKKAFFEYNYQAEEFWNENEPGSWKLKRSEILNDKFLVDGKELK